MDKPLTSQRLILRLITLSDLEQIHKLHSLPETDAFNTLGIPKDLQETKAVITPWIDEHKNQDIKNYTFAITNQQTQAFLGLFGLKLWSKKHSRAEIWYKIHSDYWNKGYATEAANRILDFGFDDLKLHRIQAGCAIENHGSIKVLEKIGMIKEGRGRKILPLKDGWSDNFEYSILESDPRRNQ